MNDTASLFLSAMHHLEHDSPNKDLIALGIQQPWAELILQGVKSVEVRNVPVGMRSTIYIYSSRKLSTFPDAEIAVEKYNLEVETLPRGKIVGTIDIVGCRKCEPDDADAACVSWSLMENRYAWQLSNPQRCVPPLQPRFLPYGMWFYPFERRNKSEQ